MDRTQLTQLVDATVLELRALLRNKGGEYASDQDVLANFKRGAALVGVNPLTCLFIYLSKHYDAIATYVRDKEEGKDRVRTEPIAGRLDDLINYCLLAKAIIAEEEGVFLMDQMAKGYEFLDSLWLKSLDREWKLIGPDAVATFVKLPAEPNKLFYYSGALITQYSLDGEKWIALP